MRGELVGLHLGGWNDASPPPSPESALSADAAKTGVRGAGGKKGRGEANGRGGAAAVAVAAQKIRDHERSLQLGMADVGTSARGSIIKLEQQLSAGGYAIHLGSSRVAALCRASFEVAAPIGELQGGSDLDGGASRPPPRKKRRSGGGGGGGGGSS